MAGNSKMCTSQIFGEAVLGLEGKFLFGKKSSSRAVSGQRESIDSQWDEFYVETFLSPLDTAVVLPMEQDVTPSKKDLFAVEKDCAVGFTKLTPVQPKLWEVATVTLDDEAYLKHLKMENVQDFEAVGINVRFAFKSSWPECGDEFLKRPRHHQWPPTNLLKRIKEVGVHIIAEASPESCQPDIEWKFSFNQSEKLLCKRMASAMKHGYFYLKTVCQFLFQDQQYQFDHKHAVFKPELRAVFLYSCEELAGDKFEEQPGHCLLYMLQRLEAGLQQGHVPHYFIPGWNLIAHVEKKVLHWHAQQLNWFRKFVLEETFLLFDRSELINNFGLGKCLEMLISDAQKFVVHKNIVTSYRECFLPLNILCIQNWVKSQFFDKAKDICEATFQECTTYIESFDGNEDILLKSVDGLPLQEKWLFAFYMDLMISSLLLEVVCHGHECVPLNSVFGDDCTRALNSNISGPVLVPQTIIYSENVVSFAEAFTKILKQEEDKTAFIAASHFFLKCSTRDLLLSMDKEEKEGNYHTGHNSTKMKLYLMFVSLYNEYDREKRWMDFYDLMEEYDLLSRHYHHAGINSHVATMWEYFNHPDKCQEAVGRWRSLTAQ